MKKINYIFLILVLILCSFSFVSCKNKKDIKSAETKMYYRNSGYVDLGLDDEFNISSNGKENIVYFDDDTIMVKSGAEFFVRPKDSNFKICYNNIFANFSTCQILKVIVNNKETSNNKENPINLTINNKTTISAKFVEFETVGIANLIKTNSSDNPKITFSGNSFTCVNGTLYYAFLKNDRDMTDLDVSNFSSNIVFDVKENVVSSKKEEKHILQFTFERNPGSKEQSAYIMLKDTNGDLYLCTMNQASSSEFNLMGTSSSNFKYDEISLKFDANLETKSEYERWWKL